MTEWPWVISGFAITYGSIAGYFAMLHLRRVRVRRESERLR